MDVNVNPVFLMKYFATVFLTTALLASYGCSSSDSKKDPGPGAAQGRIPDKVGVVSITDSAFWEEVSLFAQFFEVDAQDYHFLRKIHGLDLALDSCKYFTNDEIVAVYETPPKKISAGDKLSVFVENALSFEANKVLDSGNEDDLDYEVESEDFPEYKLPENSTLLIPGDVFPAFTGVDIPPVESFEGLKISENGVDVDMELVEKWAYIPSSNTHFEWRTSQVESSSSTVHVSAILYSRYGQDAQVNIVVCKVNDDGSFQFPDEAQSYFDGSTSSRLRVARQNTIVKSEDNVDLIVTHDSEYLWF